MDCMILFSIWHLVGVLGDQDAVKSVSVMERESVTLDPELTDIQIDKEIEWRFGEPRIARVLMNITKYYDERFSDRLNLYRNGSLTITNTRTTDSGLYQLKTIIQKKDAVRRFNVTVDGYKSISTITPQNPSSSKSVSATELHPQTPSVSQIVLISAAGSLLILAAVGIFCICRKHRKTDQQVQTRNEEITYADPTFYKRYTQKVNVKQEDEVVYAGVVTRR